jgi:hypothetical protein
MNNFIDRFQVPKLNQDQINYLNSPITPKEIETVSYTLPTPPPSKKKKKKKKPRMMVLMQSSIRPSRKT